MIQSGPVFSTGGRLLLGDACCPEPGRIVGVEELPFIPQLIHLPSYPSKPITLMTLCGLVYVILRRGRGNLQSGFLNPDPVLNVSVAAQSPGSRAHRKLVLGRVRLATPRTTFREDCIRRGPWKGFKRGLTGWVPPVPLQDSRRQGGSSRRSSLLVWRPILIMSSEGESLGGGLLWTNAGESGPWGIGRAHLE